MRLMFCVLIALSLMTWSQEDYHKQSKSEEEQLKAQHSPLGFLNASGLFQVGRSDIRVKYVKNNGIAYKGGLREGDIILAANGKSFAKATNDINDGGKGPREDLGYAMEQSLAEKNKTLLLTVLREKQKIDLKLSMPDIAPLAKTYPYYCKRSDLTLERICDELLEMQKPDGTWGGSVQTGTAALALLGTGNKKYSKAVKRAAHSYIGKNLNTGGLPTWNYIFGGTFLCEYYLATGDFKVLDPIRNICDTLALKATSENGRHAHGITKEPGYDGAGINIITGHVYLVWTLAEKCGISIHEKPYEATLAHLIRCTEASGGTGYIGAYGNGDGSGRTGLFTLGLYLSGDDKKLQKIQGEYLERHTRRMREAHANGLFGMVWGSAALACVNPKGFRKHMDYWKWYINMGRTPEGHDLARYYIGSKRNNGGDGYLGWDKYNHAAIAMMFAIGRKKLFIHGNNVRNWYNSKGGESMVAFYSKTYKDKGELLDFLTKKTDEISQYHEVADTLKFLKNELRGIHKEKATEVYEAILQKIEKDIRRISLISELKPAMAYGFYLQIKEVLRYERQMADKVDPLLRSLQKNSAIRQLHEYREKYLESIQNPDRQRDLIRLKDQLKRFLAHKKHHYILKREAEFLLKQITQFESHSI